MQCHTTHSWSLVLLHCPHLRRRAVYVTGSAETHLPFKGQPPCDQHCQLSTSPRATGRESPSCGYQFGNFGHRFRCASLVPIQFSVLTFITIFNRMHWFPVAVASTSPSEGLGASCARHCTDKLTKGSSQSKTRTMCSRWIKKQPGVGVGNS